MRALPQEGKMIVGDIPDLDGAGEFIVPDGSSKCVSPILNARARLALSELEEELGGVKLPIDIWPATFADFVAQVLDYSGCEERCQPASWFREVADKKNPHGHLDRFPSAKRLKGRLEERGFYVKYYDVPTPLMFRTVDSALTFMHEAFGLGTQISRIDELTVADRIRLESDIHEHLGMTVLYTGQAFVGWRSAFYVVTHKG